MFDRLKERQQQIREADEQLAKLRRQIGEAQAQYDKATTQVHDAQAKIASMMYQQEAVTNIREHGYEFEPVEDLSELEAQRVDLEHRLVQVSQHGLWAIGKQYTLDNSLSKGKELQKAYGDGLVYVLNAYIDTKTKSITIANYPKDKELVIKKFNQLQKKGEKLGVHLNSDYLQIRVELMKNKAKQKEAKRIEQVKQREEKARLREQQKLLDEAVRELKRLEAEKEALNIAFNQVLTDDEREAIKAQLAAIDKRISDVDYRLNNQKAGWLYVISSPALPDLVKLGVTRRLNPSIRVKELSSSSLPFPFHTHGFVFSDDCFALETAIHKYFDAVRVHPDREFFYVTPKEAIDVLKNHFHCEVHFEDCEEDE